MKSFFVTLIAITIACHTSGQSIIGCWKRTSTVLEYQNGKKDDLQKTMQTSMPCLVDTKYFFNADGTHYSSSTKDCEMIDKISVATWKQNGSNLQLITKQEAKTKSLGTTYIISIKGNTMTLTHIYTNEENSKSNTKLKQLITVYTKAK